MDKKKVAVIGTNGLPANYGGFETLTENLAKELNSSYNLLVYCSKTKKSKQLKQSSGARLIYLPLKANGFQSILYDTLSTLHAFIVADVLLLLGPSAGYLLFMNSLFKKRIIVNYGGLNEWERPKYSSIARKWLKLNFSIASKYANVNIADNEVLMASLNKYFNCSAKVIKYGGDHVNPQKITQKNLLQYPFLYDSYAISVSRAQIDNNLHTILESFEQISKLKLVIISNWEATEYGKILKNKYSNYPNIILLDSIYNPEELNVLRSNAYVYIHSHSMCGTAPSLVEAMCLKQCILCFDVPTNRETTKNESIYFSDAKDLKEKITNLSPHEIEIVKSKMSVIATREYTWKKIAEQYSVAFCNC